MLDEVQRTELLMILQQAIGEMGSEIERAIGEGLMAGLRATLDTPFVDIPARPPKPSPEWPVIACAPVTVSVLAPCGCSMPMQVSITASWHGPTPLDDPDVQAAVGEAVMSDGSLRVEFEEVGSPILCKKHDRPATVVAEMRLALGNAAYEVGLIDEGETVPWHPELHIVDIFTKYILPTCEKMDQVVLDAAREIARVADLHDIPNRSEPTTVSVNLAALRALRAALPKE